MKPNPLMAAIFAIILLLTFVVVLRSAVGAPEVNTELHAVEENHEGVAEGDTTVELGETAEEEHEKPQEPEH